jgi:glycosyltransferase involved in cell wall biosynthesis
MCESRPSPAEKTEMKKLLFVATYFPPIPSGGNARQLRFLRYLPEFGWEPVVLTYRARGPVPDPEGVRVVRTLTPTLDAAYALARRVTAAPQARRPAVPPPTGSATEARHSLIAGQKRRSRRQDIDRWLFVPDPYVGWVPPAVLAGVRLAHREGIAAIFSSYPRASTHLAAAGIAARTGLPWLADYRDPWPTHQYLRYKTVLHERANVALERWALSRASAVTAVNEPIAEDLRQRFPALASRVDVVPNGFDRSETAADVALGDGFWFVHTGRLYSRGDKVARFLDALAKLPREVGVVFVGTDGGSIQAYARSLGIAERVRTVPYVAHAVALGYQRAASALLLITGDAPESLSSKIFEYLQSGRPVFAVTPATSAAAHLLDEAGGGRRPAGDAPLESALATFVADVRAGRLPAPDPDVVNRFDGRALTRRLADILDGLAHDGG